MSSPNLLFIFTDEQRFDLLQNEAVDMPRLREFSQSATTFDEAYCTQPVCTPSRGSILTGLYPHSHGAYHNNIPLNADAQCLPELLQSEYTTAYHGKWHLGDEIFAQHGFEEWISIEDHYAPHYSEERNPNEKCSYFHFLRENGFKPDLDEEFSRERACTLPERYGKPAFLAQEACRFIQENKDRPFVHYVNFLEPHMPFFGPRTSLYDPETIPLFPNYDAVPDDSGPLIARLKAEAYRRRGFEWYDLNTEAGWRQMTAAYMGLCTQIDHYTGVILDQLEASGLADNTIVVFTSDHGETMGSHRLLGKTVRYQESIRVPLIVRLPGQKEAHTITGPSSQIDLVPTLLDLMDQKIPDGLHGKSQAEALRAGDTHLQDDVVLCWNGRKKETEIPQWQIDLAGSAERVRSALEENTRSLISSDGWRFTYSPELQEHELIDLKNDPSESHNLFGQAQHSGRIDDMMGKLRAWQEKTGDGVKLDDLN